jgi:hypothetical protein
MHIWISYLQIDTVIEAKLRRKHNLTGDLVRDAIENVKNLTVYRVENTGYGEKYHVIGSDTHGNLISAYVESRDPNDGFFILRTAKYL